MRTAGRLLTTRLTLALALSLALVGACAPTSGPLGSPSSPAPTGNASVVPPSGDATPGATDQPSAGASTTASASAVAPSASPAAPSSSTPAPATPVPAASTAAATPSPTPSGTIIVRAYFMLGSSTGNAGLVPVLREIPTTVSVASAAVRQLIAGPTAKELAAHPAMYTSVPASTKLLGINIAAGMATVDLSEEFNQGFMAGTPDSRYAQVVYTLTQFSTVQRVTVQIEGQAAATPFTRQTYQEAFLPAIFVDRPAWGAAAGNPAKVSGVANVFEAAFRVAIKDAKGTVLADQPVSASCGTGCWGTFSTTVGYTVSKAQWGTLRVYDHSAKDGSVIDVVDYPVWLTPAG